MKPAHARALDILKSRDGTELRVTLTSGQVCKVFNIAWGHDMGEDIARITTNMSPDQPPMGLGDAPELNFFRADEITRIVDPYDQKVLFEVSVHERS